MPWVLVLWWERDTPRLIKGFDSSLKHWSRPQRFTAYYYVDVDGKSVIVSAFSGRSSAGTSLQETLIEHALSLEIPKASIIIELHTDACIDAAGHALQDHRSEGIVEPSQTTDGHLD